MIWQNGSSGGRSAGGAPPTVPATSGSRAEPDNRHPGTRGPPYNMPVQRHAGTCAEQRATSAWQGAAWDICQRLQSAHASSPERQHLRAHAGADGLEALASMRKNDLGGCTRVTLKGAPFERALVQQSNHISKPCTRAPFQRAAPNLQKTVLISQRRVLPSHIRAFREVVAIWVFNWRARNYIPYLEQ